VARIAGWQPFWVTRQAYAAACLVEAYGALVFSRPPGCSTRRGVLRHDRVDLRSSWPRDYRAGCRKTVGKAILPDAQPTLRRSQSLAETRLGDRTMVLTVVPTPFHLAMWVLAWGGDQGRVLLARSLARHGVAILPAMQRATDEMVDSTRSVCGFPG